MSLIFFDIIYRHDDCICPTDMCELHAALWMQWSLATFLASLHPTVKHCARQCETAKQNGKTKKQHLQMAPPSRSICLPHINRSGLTAGKESLNHFRPWKKSGYINEWSWRVMLGPVSHLNSFQVANTVVEGHRVKHYITILGFSGEHHGNLLWITMKTPKFIMFHLVSAGNSDHSFPNSLLCTATEDWLVGHFLRTNMQLRDH